MNGDATPDDREIAHRRGFGPTGILASLLVLGGLFLGPLKGFPVLLWAQWSRTPWRDLGLVRPASWARTAIAGIVFGVAFKFAMKAIVMPLLGAAPVNATYSYVTGNLGAMLYMLLLVTVGAGFGEELIFRGFLFERLTKLFGTSAGAKVAIVLATATFFGVLHYPEQGIAGAEQALIVGLTYGTIFAVTGRIWMLVFAHAAFDVTAVLMIYWNLETGIAHWIFK